MDIIKRFINYVKIDTTSDPYSNTCPSTDKQKNLGKILVEELKNLGLNGFMDKHGYVYAHIPATKKEITPIGFIAHMDTSPDAPGYPVKPRIINNYDGKPIKLNDSLTMDPKEFDMLKTMIGDDLIVTDGNTLLGADNKAGIAIIMDFIKKLKELKLEHGNIYIGFTPDEEIGRGADLFDLNFFKAKFAYTVDGGEVGGIDYENFNASSAKVTLTGKSIHPGSAKNKLINATHLAMEFHSMLPPFLVPENTELKEGFNHLSSITGQVEHATLEYIIRNHDFNLFKKQEKDFINIKDYLNNKYGYEACKVDIVESYLNMYNIIKDDLTPINLARKAIQNVGLNPISDAIRGGTDGARLTYMGLPTPNLGTGGYNFHGRFEFLNINEMKLAVDVLIEIIKELK